MQTKNQKAFTMLELTFAIVIIGILSAIALPKLAATRDDAIITKARTTVAAVRNAISTERQKRILRGNYTPITSITKVSAYNADMFDFFDNNTSLPVLEYPLRACSGPGAKGCWVKSTSGKYVFFFPNNNIFAVFDINGSRFNCLVGLGGATQDDCDLLTQ